MPPAPPPAKGYEYHTHLRIGVAPACGQLRGPAITQAEEAGRLTDDPAQVTCGSCKRTPWCR
jgi:hypothetical protein